MMLEISKERETPLLSRKRVTLSLQYEGPTPPRLELRKEVAKKLKADEKLVVLKHIYTRFGSQKAKIIANVYSDEKAMKNIEEKYLLEKHNPGAKKKEEGETEAKAEAKKEAPKK